MRLLSRRSDLEFQLRAIDAVPERLQSVFYLSSIVSILPTWLAETRYAVSL